MHASDGGPIDDFAELIVCVLFLLLGFMGTIYYVQWANSHIFDDTTRDKVKYTVNEGQRDLGNLNAIVLDAEEVAFMCKFKRNNFNQSCPSLVLNPVRDEGQPVMFLPDPTTDWKNYVSNIIKKSMAGVFEMGPNNSPKQYTLSLVPIQLNDSYTWRKRSNGTRVKVFPIEVATTGDVTQVKYNPAFDSTNTTYVIPHYNEEGWYVWQID